MKDLDEDCDGLKPLSVELDKSWMNWQDEINKDLKKTMNAVPMAGVKHDHMKRDFTLLPWAAVEEVVKVLEFGAAKYARDNWRKVDKPRYVKAAFRHLIAYARGEVNDSESGLPHLAHLACCVLFLLEL